MQYHEFIGQVQNRLRMGKQAEAVRATRAVLSTLGERVQAGEARDLAGALPMEVDYYLLSAEHGQRFDWDEFVRRVAEREHMTGEDAYPDAAYHAKAVMALVAEVVPGGEIAQVRQQLPGDEDWDDLFELVGVEGAFEKEGWAGR